MRYLVIFSVFVMASCASKQADKSAAESAKAPVSSDKKAVPVNAKAKSDGDKITCQKNKDIRIIEVVAKENGCEVNYTKLEKTTMKGSSAIGMQNCQNIKEKMKGHLVAAGYQCN
jgi:hypothetical protein